MSGFPLYFYPVGTHSHWKGIGFPHGNMCTVPNKKYHVPNIGKVSILGLVLKISNREK
jgi:hypothetical protein